MTTLSRLVARALPWRRNPARPADQPGGQHAQPLPLRPEDLRRTINLSEFKWALWWLSGGAVISFLAILATAVFAVAGLLHWQIEAGFAAGVSVLTAWMATAFTLSCLRGLYREYSATISRTDEANRENERLFRQNLRILTNLARREEGEAGGDGGTEYSPSASRFRRIPLKGEVH